MFHCKTSKQVTILHYIEYNSQMRFFVFLFVGIGLTLVLSSKVIVSDECPMNFDPLQNLINVIAPPLKLNDLPTECNYMLTALRIVRAEYLRSTSRFFPSETTSEACWDSYQRLVNSKVPGFDVRSNCGFKSGLMTNTCKNITTLSDFELLVSKLDRDDVILKCSESLGDDSVCKSCTDSLARIGLSYFTSPSSNGNESDCSGYSFVYAAGVVNRGGPIDLGTTKCLFSLDFSTIAKKGKKKYGIVFWGIFVGCTNGFFGAVFVLWVVWVWHLKNRRRKNNSPARIESGRASCNDSGQPESLIRFDIEEIRKATNNFSLDNLIGKGGYGNVYRGVLSDGSEVALKRFKNCGPGGDAGFTHEVEVIASVKHVNLVALRGYCTASRAIEGHQRIIVCDLMLNGSLYDHLFGSFCEETLSWPVCQRIALGTARGLAYLHHGVQPAIIHRDVKASNILLDEDFEPRLTDFGLAKFTQDGFSHLSTQVAGTLGYVAPEYALYGQLTERSDVYSFGVVLLEILSRKKAVISIEDGKALLLADWAWSLVRADRALDVIDPQIPQLGPIPNELLEKYVLVAVLCSHPLLYARPTMDYVVKLLETDSPVPSIPDRGPSIVFGTGPGEISSSSHSLQSGLHSSLWLEPVYRSDHPILDRMESEANSSEVVT